MKYTCHDERRLEVVKNRGTLNAIEYLEVSDHDAPSDDLRQRTLFVKLVRAAPALDEGNVRIDGGDRIPTVQVEWVARADALPASEAPALIDGLDPPDHFLVVRTEGFADFSQYRLRLVTSQTEEAPPPGFDPRLAQVDFSFKVECPTDLDCVDGPEASSPPLPGPQLDYLARDYASFRRLMLDRMSLVAPDWRERNPADLGVALVEALAYVADRLAYRQDAVATEAYIGTARSRVSLRRHARLVDYRVHEGSNARAWMQFLTEDGGVLVRKGTQLLTRTSGLPGRLDALSDPGYEDALNRGAEVFETVHDTVLYADHRRFEFYTWGDAECALPRGSRTATLHGDFPRLKAGDVLVFVEEVGPRTGVAADADPVRRWPVRLTHVRPAADPSGGLFLDPPTGDPVSVTEIEWAAEDALPFDLCLSARTAGDAGGDYLPAVSVALGNIVLADHGRTLPEPEALGVVRASGIRLAPRAAGCEADPPEVPPRFRPLLHQRPLTYAIPYEASQLFATDAAPALVADLDTLTYSPALDAWMRAGGIVFEHPVVVRGGDGFWSLSDGARSLTVRRVTERLHIHALLPPAKTSTEANPRDAGPAILLHGAHAADIAEWRPRFDLLASGSDEREFVVEAEHDGTAALRFGDDVYGRRPEVGTRFTATYRVGNGRAGNVGAESIVHVVTGDGRVLGVTNPLPATGGVDPETAEAIRRDAPEAFRTQERAVTPADYADVARRHPGVHRAASTFRWTGSWHTVYLTVDREGGAPLGTEYRASLRGHLNRYRMAGYDLEVDAPSFVPIEVALDVCVLPDYFRAHVKQELLHVLGRGWLPDGTRAFFHPDNFTFGQPLYLSDLYARAQAVTGVESVVVTTFQRLLAPDRKPLADGLLPMGRLEIARLDNDPGFPERGLLTITVGGGR